MTLLLMDTSGDYGVLALADAASGTLRAARVFEGRRTLSRRLLGELEGLLAGEGITIGDVTAFGIGLGPGSFTGVRVGVTTAKTFAQVTGKPLVGIPTPDAYAAAWAASGVACAVILPSRRGEAYVSLYAPPDPDPQVFAERFEPLERRLAALEGERPLVCCGAVGLPSFRPALALPLSHVPPDGLAQVGAARLGAGQLDDPLSLTPLYVVAPSITSPREKPA